MTTKEDDSFNKEIRKYEKEDIVEAQKCLNELLKTTPINTTTFNKLLFGLIDSYASKSDEYETKDEHTNNNYRKIMTFCADRLTTLNKPRATNKLLKEFTEQYTKRDEWRKELRIRRITQYVSVGEHQFSAYKPEYEQGYDEQQKKVEDALRYYTGDMITQKQKKLTSCVNTISRDLLNEKLGDVLSRRDLDTVKSAVRIIENVKNTVIHTKEVIKRTEKRREIERKNRELNCSKAVQSVKIKDYHLTELVNLAIHYTKIPERFQTHQEYMLAENYLISEIRKLDTQTIGRFKHRLVGQLTNGLTYTVEEIAYKREYIGAGNIEYIKKIAPKEAILQFINDWKGSNFEKINTTYDTDFTLIKSITVMSDIVDKGVKP